MSWHATKHLVPNQFGYNLRLINEKGTVLANLGMAPNPQTLALITAAPDLLAACRACVAIMANTRPDGSVMADLLAAIKKAEDVESQPIKF
jgi:hypothetical protein